LEERKKILADRKSRLEVQRQQELQEEQVELKALEEKKHEIDARQTELNSRLVKLEAKPMIGKERRDTVAQTLSLKEKEYLNLLSPQEQKALESIVAHPQSKEKKKGGLWGSKKKDKASALAGLPHSFVPLPPSDWKEAVSPDGRMYYYNSKTRESSWEKPKLQSDLTSFFTPEEQEKLRLTSISYDERGYKLVKEQEKKRPRAETQRF